MKLDLSKFKKVFSDAHSTTMQHPDGHMIQVAHKALSPKMREQLSALEVPAIADGGQASDSPPEAPKKNAKEMEEGATSSGVPSGDEIVKNIKEGLGLAKGGEAKDPTQRNLLPGDKIPNAIEKQVVKEASRGPNNPKLAESKKQPPKARAYADGTPDEPVQSVQPDPNADPTADLPQQPPVQDAPSMGQPQAAQPPQSQSPPSDGEADVASGVMGGIQEQKEGLAYEYAAGVAKAKGEAQALQQSQNDRTDAISNLNGRMDTLNDERQGLQDYLNDPKNAVDPGRYLGNQGTVGRIRSAIAVILGGAAAGRGGTNQALNYIQQQISNDIDAQKANLGVKQNLLSANLHATGDLSNAAAMTNVIMNDQVSNQMKLAAARAGNQMAAAQFMENSGKLDQQSGMIMATIGAKQQINDPNSKDSDVNHALNVLRMVAPDQAKEVQARYVPSMGLATVPVPESVRGQLVGRSTLNNNIQQLIAFQQKYGGSLEGIADPRIRAQGEALVKQVQDQYRRGNDQGVFKPAEAAFVNGVLADNPSSLFSKFTKAPAYRMAAAINQGNLNQLKSAYGLRTPAPIATRPPKLPDIK